LPAFTGPTCQSERPLQISEFASNLAWEARHSRRAVSRGETKTEVLAPHTPESEGAEARSGFPAGSPSGPKPRRFAAWQIGNRSSVFPPWRLLGPKPANSRPAGSLAEALVLPDRSMSRSPGFPPLRSPRAEARSCPKEMKPKLLFRRWQRADRSPAFAWAGPEPKSGVLPIRSQKPEGSRFRNGLPRARRPPGVRWALYETCRFRFR
jgi:hypothetical protein